MLSLLCTFFESYGKLVLHLLNAEPRCPAAGNGSGKKEMPCKFSINLEGKIKSNLLHGKMRYFFGNTMQLLKKAFDLFSTFFNAKACQKIAMFLENLFQNICGLPSSQKFSRRKVSMKPVASTVVGVF